MRYNTEQKGIIATIVLPLIFFSRELLGLRVFAGFDFTHLILPIHDYTRTSFQNGEFPHWNPYMFAGFPHHAEGEGGIFYFGNWLLSLNLDQSVALSWVIVLHLIFAGCMMYALLRSRGVSQTASGWIAIMYQFTPGLILRFETVGLFQAACWLPAFFLVIEMAVNSVIGIEDIKLKMSQVRDWIMYSLIAAAIISFMLTAGSSQIAFYAMVGSVFYLGGVAAAGPMPWRKAAFALGTFVIAALIGAVLSAIQTMPTGEIAQYSYRVQEANAEFFRIGTWLNIPRLTSLFMFPAVKDSSELLDYITSLGYIGLLPFLLIGVTLSFHRRNMNPILAPFFLVFFGLLLSFGLNFVANRDLLSYPGFNLFRALGRMILPVQIGLFALAAVGLDLILVSIKSDALYGRIVAGTLMGGAIGLVLLVWKYLSEAGDFTAFETFGFIHLAIAIVLSIVFFILVSREFPKKLGFLLLSLWVLQQIISLIPVNDLITMNRSDWKQVKISMEVLHEKIKTDEARPPRVLLPTELDVFGPLVQKLSGNAESNLKLPTPAFGDELTLAGIGVANSYTPLVSDRWHALAHEYAAKGLDEVAEASGRFTNIMELACIDGIIAPDSFVGGGDYTILETDLSRLYPDGYHLLRTPATVPFVSAPDRVELWDWSDWEVFKHWVVEPDYIPGEKVCVEISEGSDMINNYDVSNLWTDDREEDPVMTAWGELNYPEERSVEIDEIVRDLNEIRFKVTSTYNCWIVVRESWFPGWAAYIDGRAIEIYPADLLFIGIPVRAGNHEVTLEYRTPKLNYARRITSAGWMAWAAMMLLVIFSKGNDRLSSRRTRKA